MPNNSKFVQENRLRKAIRTGASTLWARPPALPRLAPEMDTKETFKSKGRSYIEERFDRNRIDDPFLRFQ
jgi:hypothetical protein